MITHIELIGVFLTRPALAILCLRATRSLVTLQALSELRSLQIEQEAQILRAAQDEANAGAHITAAAAAAGIDLPSSPSPQRPTISPLRLYADLIAALLPYRADPPAGPTLVRMAASILLEPVDPGQALRLARDEGHPVTRPIPGSELVADWLHIGIQAARPAAAMALPREQIGAVLAALGVSLAVEPGDQDPALPVYSPRHQQFTLASPWPWIGTEDDIGVSRLQRLGATHQGALLGVLQKLGRAALDGPSCLRAVMFAGGPFDVAALNHHHELWSQTLGLRGNPSTRPLELDGMSGVVHEYHWSSLTVPCCERRYVIPLPQGGCVLWWECPAADVPRWSQGIDAIVHSLRFGPQAPRRLRPGLELGTGVPAVDAALDGAWLYDIGQGDLVAARVAAGRALAERPDSWQAQFARAAVDATAGEYAAALARLEALWPGDDPAQRRLVACLGFRTEARSWGLRPDGGVGSHGFLATPTVWLARFDAAMGPGSRDLREMLLEGVGVDAARRFTYDAMSESAHAGIGLSTRRTIAAIREAGMHAFQGHQVRLSAFMITVAVRLAANLDETSESLGQLATLTDQAASAGDRLMSAWCRAAWAEGLLAARAREAARDLGAPVPFLVAPRTDDDASACDLARQQFASAVAEYRQAGAPRGAVWATCRLAALDAIEGRPAPALAALAAAEQEAAALEDRTLARDAAFLALWIDAQRGAPEAALHRRAAYLAGSAQTDGAVGSSAAWARIFRRTGAARFARDHHAEALLANLQVASAAFVAVGAEGQVVELAVERITTLVTLQAYPEAAAELERAMPRLEQRLAAGGGEPALWAALAQLGMAAQRIHAGLLDPKQTETLGLRLQAIADLLSASDPPPDLDVLRLDFPEVVKQGKLAAFELALAALPREVARATCRFAARSARFFAAFVQAQDSLESGRRDLARPALERAREAAKELGEQRTFYLALCAALERDRPGTLALAREYADAGFPFEPKQALLQFSLLAAKTAEPGAGDPFLARRVTMIVELLERVDAWPEAAQLLARRDALMTSGAATREPDDPALLLTRARIADGLGDPIVAEAYFGAAAAALETARTALRSERLRRALAAQRLFTDVHALWTLSLAAQGRWDDAFVQADRVRSRSLVEGLTATVEAPAVTQLRAEAERLQSELMSARAHDSPQIELLESALAAAEQRLAELDTSELAAPPAVQLAEVTARLGDGTLLLAYLFHHDTLLAWAVTRHGIVRTLRVTELAGTRFAARPFGARLRAATQELSRLCPTRELRDELAGELAKLADLLLAPFTAEIEAATRIIIVPHAELTTFAFAALPVQDRRLGLTKPLTVVFALSLLTTPTAPTRPHAAAPALVVGNPAAMAVTRRVDGSTRTLVQLRGAEEEARRVAAIHRVTPLLGAAATRDEVLRRLAASPSVVHFATHGSFDPEIPLASCVVLADGEVLAADTWAGLRMRSEVVILSACSTARGQLQGGEVIGLTRAILLAGARAVIVTLWPVLDGLSAALMTTLHEGLRRGATVDEALMKACARVANFGRAQLDEARGIVGDHDQVRDFLAEEADTRTLDPAWPACWAAFIVVRAAT